MLLALSRVMLTLWLLCPYADNLTHLLCYGRLGVDACLCLYLVDSLKWLAVKHGSLFLQSSTTSPMSTVSACPHEARMVCLLPTRLPAAELVHVYWSRNQN